MYIYPKVISHAYIYVCGEDFYWLMSFNAESNESGVGKQIKQIVRVGPWALVRVLMAPPGPLWAGPLWAGRLWAGPLWAPLGPYGLGP